MTPPSVSWWPLGVGQSPWSCADGRGRAEYHEPAIASVVPALPEIQQRE